MTTTLRPTGPLRQGHDGARSRTYDVCVNSRRVGSIDISTDPAFGAGTGVLAGLAIDEPDRGRGRGTVAMLAAEEVLRGWGCTQVRFAVPADATAAQRLTAALGYTERGRNMLKELPPDSPPLPGGVESRPMTEAEFDTWLASAIDTYTRNWIERGVPAEQARAKSEADHRRNLPDGLASPDTHIHVLVHEGTVVGHIWVALTDVRPGERGAYVFDVEVRAEHRGHGYGRALMLLAETIALREGVPLIGLHVFADNTPAQRLYESLGYATTRFNLAKQL